MKMFHMKHEGRENMIAAFIVGLTIGGALGMLFTACLVASGKEEENDKM